MTILRLSDSARAGQAAALARSIDAAGAGAALCLYDAPGGRCLARLPLPLPCGKVAGVSLDLGPVAQARALATGRCSWAQIEDGAGTAVLDCDVGEQGAVLILNSVAIAKGGPVQIDRFVIAVP